MSSHKEKTNFIKNILTDALITFCVFCLVMFMVAFMLYAELITIEYMKIISAISIVFSSSVAVVIAHTISKSDANNVVPILSASTISMFMVIWFLVGKGKGDRLQDLIISAILVFVGKFIPNVIKTRTFKRKKAKRRKRTYF